MLAESQLTLYLAALYENHFIHNQDSQIKGGAFTCL